LMTLCALAYVARPLRDAARCVSALKVFNVSLYARVSTHDQQFLAMSLVTALGSDCSEELILLAVITISGIAPESVAAASGLAQKARLGRSPSVPQTVPPTSPHRCTRRFMFIDLLFFRTSPGDGRICVVGPKVKHNY